MKDRGLVSALGKMLNALVAQVQGQIVLGEIKFHNAVISAHINGEEKPRIFEDASAVRILVTKRISAQLGSNNFACLV